MPQPMPQPVANTQQGFTLVELLIAVVVVALGLLGHASLQAQSTRTANQARFEQAANTIVLDLSQRIQSLPLAVTNNNFNISNLNDGLTPQFSDCLDANVDCDRAQFAAFEVGSWFLQARQTLPLLRFSIEHADNLVDIKLVWDAGLTGSGADACIEGSVHRCREVSLWIK